MPKLAKLIAILFSLWLVTDSAWADELNRIENTFAFRLENVRQLVRTGKLQQAEIAFAQLVELFDSSAPLAAEAWLEAAALQKRMGKTAEARQGYREVLDRFANLPWAVSQAQKELQRLESNPAQQWPESTQDQPIEDRPITLDLKKASLSQLSAFFAELGVKLDLDPALADRRISISVRKTPVHTAIQNLATQLGARLEAHGSTFKLVARSASVAENERIPPIKWSGGGTLSRKVIQNVIRSSVGQIKLCYDKALKGNKNLAGTITIEFVIQPNGTVGKAKVFKSDLGDPATEVCLLEAITKWVFPKPKGGDRMIHIRYPFIFKPGKK